MRHQTLVAMVAGGSVALAGPVYGETTPDPAEPVGDTRAEEVWGDPEEGEATSPGWTWFGMGYERRNRGQQGSGRGEGDVGPPAGANRDAK